MVLDFMKLIVTAINVSINVNLINCMIKCFISFCFFYTATMYGFFKDLNLVFDIPVQILSNEHCDFILKIFERFAAIVMFFIGSLSTNMVFIFVVLIMY